MLHCTLGSPVKIEIVQSAMMQCIVLDGHQDTDGCFALVLGLVFAVSPAARWLVKARLLACQAHLCALEFVARTSKSSRQLTPTADKVRTLYNRCQHTR
jgi:hypothetical protein